MTDAVESAGDVLVTGTEARTQTTPHEVDLQALCHLAATVLVGEGVGRGALDIHLVDAEPMAELNQEHMGHVGPTDVLSFPLDLPPADSCLPGTSPDGAASEPPPEMLLLGDIVICPEVAAHQAATHVGTIDGELKLLVIHGVLHVLGHDHAEPEETLVMQSRERHYLGQLGLAHPVQQ